MFSIRSHLCHRMSNLRSNVSSCIAIIFAIFLFRIEVRLKYLNRYKIKQLFILQFSQSMWTKFELISLKDMNGTTSVVHYVLKPKRISRTTYGIKGTVTKKRWLQEIHGFMAVIKSIFAKYFIQKTSFISGWN